MLLFHSRQWERRGNTRRKARVPAFLTQDNNPTFTCIVVIHNISGSGALVSSTMHMSLYEKYTLHVKFPYHQKWFGRDELEVIVQGKVIRANDNDKRYAIQFLDDLRIKTSLPD